MSRPTHVYVVACPRPRVGKTLVARALTEFYRADGRPVAGFDLGSGDNGLTAFLPKFALAAQITDTRGQMALFDKLIVADEKPKVVDLDAGQFESFFKVMADIGFVSEARRRAIEPVVMFIATTDDRSVAAFAELHQSFADLTVVPVYNEGVARGTYLRDKYPSRGALAIPVQVPQLSPSLKHIVDTKPFSFSAFRRGLSFDVPDILEAELASWVKRLFLQFRELELRLLLHRLSSSLTVEPEQQSGS